MVHLLRSRSTKGSVRTCTRGNGPKPIKCKFWQCRSNAYMSGFGFLLSLLLNWAHFLFKNNWQNFMVWKQKIRQLLLRSVKANHFHVLWGSWNKPFCQKTCMYCCDLVVGSKRGCFLCLADRDRTFKFGGCETWCVVMLCGSGRTEGINH